MPRWTLPLTPHLLWVLRTQYGVADVHFTRLERLDTRRMRRPDVQTLTQEYARAHGAAGLVALEVCQITGAMTQFWVIGGSSARTKVVVPLSVRNPRVLLVACFKAEDAIDLSVSSLDPGPDPSSDENPDTRFVIRV